MEAMVPSQMTLPTSLKNTKGEVSAVSALVQFSWSPDTGNLRMNMKYVHRPKVKTPEQKNRQERLFVGVD